MRRCTVLRSGLSEAELQDRRKLRSGSPREGWHCGAVHLGSGRRYGSLLKRLTLDVHSISLGYLYFRDDMTHIDTHKKAHPLRRNWLIGWIGKGSCLIGK